MATCDLTIYDQLIIKALTAPPPTQPRKSATRALRGKHCHPGQRINVGDQPWVGVGTASAQPMNSTRSYHSHTTVVPKSHHFHINLPPSLGPLFAYPGPRNSHTTTPENSTSPLPRFDRTSLGIPPWPATTAPSATRTHHGSPRRGHLRALPHPTALSNHPQRPCPPHRTTTPSQHSNAGKEHPTPHRHRKTGLCALRTPESL
jgi:hypothetical protein